MEKIKIGKVSLDGSRILAPMSGVTNLPFRLLCKKYGAALVFSEMASSEAIIRLNEKSKTRLLSCTEERPLGIQLMGSSADNLVRSALFVQEKYNPDIIDVNLGCPAQEIIKNGCGSALLKKPGFIRDIISGLSGSINVPLTAKMRILDNYDDSLKIARTIEKAGADALIVHGRTQKQQYSGKSNIEIIKKIKKELSIPVLANGDIVDELSARNVLEYTGCDGLMIGRAAMGNPYIFRRISYYLDEGNFPSPRVNGQLDDFFEYAALCQKYDMLAYSDLKLNAQWFTKCRENIKQVRIKINLAKDINSIMEIMGKLRNEECGRGKE